MMTLDQARELQRALIARGYALAEDGYWGPVSQAAAVAAIMASAPAAAPAATRSSLAWGRKVSDVFRERVFWIADTLRMPASGADDLMACMAWESNETFSSSVRNMAGSGAVGLIQFMPTTAANLGTSTAALAAMEPHDQLRYVFRYFEPFTGRLQNLGDVYMAILWPKGVGKPDSWELWEKGKMPTTYRQNAGLDLNKDGSITKAEAVAKVRDKLLKGMQPEYRWAA